MPDRDPDPGSKSRASGGERRSSENRPPPVSRSARETVKTPSGGAGLTGERVGPYKLLQLLGEGGFGLVYLAEQEFPVRRRVALKLIRLGMDTQQVIARFEAERQALAMMNHRHIARVLDAGATEQGRPYFVMEYVPGIPITDYCDTNRLGTEERIRLFMDVCAAIQHAHQKGVIHRDIKPSNVLVTLEEGAPVAKVIDFGVAKATERHIAVHTVYTEMGQLIGTPEYMSPEQAEMTGLDIDTRTDVYSLGVLLYELLTGTLPFDPAALRACAIGEIQRIIRDVEPPKPSTRLSSLGGGLSTIAVKRQTEPGALRRSIRGDLDWITMRAMEKDRTRRYAGASDLAADLQRYLDSEPVQAGPPSASYRIRKFLLKHRASVAAGVIMTLLLVGGLVASSVLYLRASSTSSRLAKALDEAEDLRKESDAMRLRAEAQQVVAGISSASGLIDFGDYAAARRRLDAIPTRLRDWEWRFLSARLDPSLATIPLSQAVAASPALTPDGARLAYADEGGYVHVIDTASAREIASWAAHREPVSSVIYDARGEYLATASRDGTVRIWDAKDHIPVHVYRAPGPVTAAAFDADSEILVASILDGRIIVWRIEDWTAEKILPGQSDVIDAMTGAPEADNFVIRSLAVSSKDDRVVGSSVALTRAWSLQSGDEQRRLAMMLGLPDQVTAAGRGGVGASRVAFFSAVERALVIFDMSTGRRLTEVDLPRAAAPTSLTLCAGDQRIVLGYADGVVAIHDATNGAELARLPGHGKGVIAAALSADRSQLASVSLDGTMKTWDSRRAAGSIPLRERVGGAGLAFDHSGATLAAVSAIGAVQTWTTDGPTPGRGISPVLSVDLMSLRGSANHAAFSPNADTLYFIGGDASIKVGDPIAGRIREFWLADGARLESLASVPLADRVRFGRADDIPRALSISNDGTRLACARLGGRLEIWDTARRAVVATYHAEGRDFSALAFAPDDGRLAASCRDGAVVSWGPDGAAGITLAAHSPAATCLEFSPDGTRLATGGTDGVARVWDARSGRSLVELMHAGDVNDLAFSSSGRRLATACDDRAVHVFDADSGEELVALRDNQSSVVKVAFDPSGRYLASQAEDGQVTLWRAPGSADLQ